MWLRMECWPSLNMSSSPFWGVKVKLSWDFVDSLTINMQYTGLSVVNIADWMSKGVKVRMYECTYTSVWQFHVKIDYSIIFCSHRRIRSVILLDFHWGESTRASKVKVHMLQRCWVSLCNLATSLTEDGQHSNGCICNRIIFKLYTQLQHIAHSQFDCLLHVYSSNGWSPLASHSWIAGCEFQLGVLHLFMQSLWCIVLRSLEAQCGLPLIKN